MVTTVDETHVREIPGIRQAEASALARDQYTKLISVLRDLDEDEWNAPTACDRWRVRDIIAHMIGWAEATLSPKELIRLFRAARARQDELGGPLNAQNELQVDERRHLSSQELLARFEEVVPAFVKRRRLMGGPGHYVPFYTPELGLTNLGFIMNVIYTRDAFMHRIDIGRATERDLDLGDVERRIVADVVKQWGRESGGLARFHLTGPAGGDYLTADNPAATITGDAVEFCRMLTGRAETSVMSVEGDEPAARRWLETEILF